MVQGRSDFLLAFDVDGGDESRAGRAVAATRLAEERLGATGTAGTSTTTSRWVIEI